MITFYAIGLFLLFSVSQAAKKGPGAGAALDPEAGAAYFDALSTGIEVVSDVVYKEEGGSRHGWRHGGSGHQIADCSVDRPGFATAFFVQGDKDISVPIENSISLHAHAQSGGVPAELVVS